MVVDLMIVDLFGCLNFTRHGFAVLDHLWAQDNPFCPLSVECKMGTYIQQGRSKLRVWNFQKQIKIAKSINL